MFFFGFWLSSFFFSTPTMINTSSLRFALVAAGGLVLAAGLAAQTPAAPKIEFPAASPGATVKQHVGLTDVQVDYSRPGKKGRVIFGGRVPYGDVWRTGANTATKISFSTAVKLNGTDLAAGEYALFTIPGRDEWTIILNKVTGQWGAYSYDAKNDVARIAAKPVALAGTVESFEISFNDLGPDSATLNFTWDNVRVPVTLAVDVKTVLVPKIEAAMAAGGADLPYRDAAMFYYENNLDLKKAVLWMDAYIASRKDFKFPFTYRKALIQEKSGDKTAALATARESLEDASEGAGIGERRIRPPQSGSDRPIE